MSIKSTDECIKLFFSNSIEELEEEYQEWFMKNRKLIDRVLDRKINILNNLPIPGTDKQPMTYVITVFYVLTD